MPAPALSRVPPLEGPGVSLRAVDASVATLLLAASLDAEVTRWTQIPAGLTLADAGMITAGWSLPSERMARFVIHPHGGEAAGMVSVWLDPLNVAEVGYWLLDGARGRGIATAAVELVCAWVLDDCGLARLQLTTLPGNLASEAVARKCGFVVTGAVRRDIQGEQRSLRLWVRQAAPAGAAAQRESAAT